MKGMSHKHTEASSAHSLLFAALNCLRFLLVDIENLIRLIIFPLTSDFWADKNTSGCVTRWSASDFTSRQSLAALTES